jgi:hypothetical protein
MHQACTTMHARPVLLLLMHEVATSNINHHGGGLRVDVIFEGIVFIRSMTGIWP